ncbi:MAG: hypothetical protein K0R39_3273 [Symbiobacteriaceae bacterium]|nr:hypothetical protein [Symbiobacteriaceae bacterium]
MVTWQRLPDGRFSLRGADQRETLQLAARARALARACAGGAVFTDPDGLAWAAGDPVLLIPAPAGRPLKAWIAGDQAGAPALLSVVTDAVRLLDLLTGAGYIPAPFDPDEIWAHQGRVTWFPAALGWARPSRYPTSKGLRAQGRTLGLFLNHLLQWAQGVPDIGRVWEELWRLTYRLLEHGCGLSGAWVLHELQTLAARFDPDGEDAVSVPLTWVLADGPGLQRMLGYRTLDLPGLLRHLLGSSRRTAGLMLGSADLPPHYAAQAQTAGLTWCTDAEPDFEALGNDLQTAGATEVVVLCAGTADRTDLIASLPRLRPRHGRLVPLAPDGRPFLPTQWAIEPFGRPLAPWLRIGWPGRKILEVPGDGDRTHLVSKP